MFVFNRLDLCELKLFTSGTLNSIGGLPEDEQAKSFWAIFNYLLYGKEPDEDGTHKVILEYAKPYLTYLRNLAGANTDE